MFLSDSPSALGGLNNYSGKYFEFRQWHSEVQLTHVGWIQTGGVPIRTKSASLLTQSCQLLQRWFTASFLFWRERALVLASQSKQYRTGGGFLSDHHRPQRLLLPFMQIFKVHEKENKLNCNSRWNHKGVDFAFHWWLTDKTGTVQTQWRLNPPIKLIQMRYLRGIDLKWSNHFKGSHYSAGTLYCNEMNVIINGSKEGRDFVSPFIWF